MDKLEQIKNNIENVTDWYADNCEFVGDIEYLLNEVDRLKMELKAFINHTCEKMKTSADVKSYFDHEMNQTIHYCHYCGETLKTEPAPE